MGRYTIHYTYRKYIYSNNLFDFHIADTLGNLVAMPAYVCFYYAVKRNPKKLEYIIGLGIITFTLYECLGLFGLNGTFDFRDIIATFISGTLLLIW